MKTSFLIDKFYNKNPKLRKLLMSFLFPNKTLQTTIFDTPLVINTLRENGYYRAARMSQNSSLLRDEVSIFLIISHLIENDCSFIDIGANVGLFSSILSRYQNLLDNFNIYAFEANSDTYIRLKENAQQHNFKAFNIALSDHKGTLKFLDGAVSHVFTTVDNSSEYNIPSTPLIINCECLDNFKLDGEKFILKIDVEGQELNVLMGAKSFFESQKVKAVYIDGYSDAAVLDFLKSYNFLIYDGRTLKEANNNTFALLAIQDS